MPKASQNRQKTQAGNGAEHVPSAPEVAAYIAPVAGELGALARRSGLADLAYLLEMAQLEATLKLPQSGKA